MNKALKITSYIALGGLLVGALVYYNFIDKSGTKEIYKVGEKAPEQDLELVFNNEGSWNIKDHTGKVVILNFWAEWCGPCVKELPYFIKAQQDYLDKGVEFLAIHDSETEIPVINNCIKNHWGEDCKMPFAKDNSKDPYIEKFCTDATLPVTVVIDKEGIINETRIGSYPEQALLDKIESLL